MMQSRGLYIATAVLVILGGVWYWSEHRKPSEDTSKTSADTPPAILKLDQGSITGIQLTKRNSPPVVLAKNSSGEWQITASKPLRADQSAVSGLLGAVSSLNSERLLEDKATNPAQYGLAPAALQVDLSLKDNKSQQLLIGDDTPTGGSVYAMLAGDPRLFTIASYTKTSLDKGVNDLRDKRLITVTADNISRIELIKKGFGLEFDRNKDQWQILRPKPLRANNIEVSDLVRQLTEAKMDTTADVVKASSDFAKATTVATAKVTDQSGIQQLEIRKIKDDYYAKSSAVEGACKVDSALGKEVEKNLDDFRNKSLFDFGFTTPNKIEIHAGAKVYLLTRGTAGEDDWWSNGKKMDGTKVSDLVSKLRELSAAGFADSGFSNPSIELTVTSNDGKRTENVSIAKSGDGYLAQRQGEPALYKLTSDQVNDLVKAAAAL